VGGLNIDASRISIKQGDGWNVPIPDASTAYPAFVRHARENSDTFEWTDKRQTPHAKGRWPANVILDEVSAGLLDEQSGENPSRFFYVAKASKRDRNEGLEELQAMQARNFAQDKWTLENMPFGENPRQNFHPTVKPTQLMRYLIKLVTPEGGVVLDPFTGSGSTGKAALLDGYRFVGAELTEEYLPIIEGRLRWASEQGVETDDTLF
jgi:hypothetical protein